MSSKNRLRRRTCDLVAVCLLPVILVLPSQATAQAAATVCQPMMEDVPPVFEMAFDLARGASVERKLLLPSGRDIIVFVRERGVDVRVEITSGPVRIAAADNAVHRTGIQRLSVRTEPGARYLLAMERKEATGEAGSVVVRAVIVNESSGDCATVQRLLAKADSDYAAAQEVSRIAPRSTPAAKPIDLYKASAAGYKSAAGALAGPAVSMLRAESEHALAATMYLGIQDWVASCEAAGRASSEYESAGDDYGAERSKTLMAASLMEMAPSSPSSCDGGSLDARNDYIQRLLMAAARFHAAHDQHFDEAAALNFAGLNLWADDSFRDSLPLLEQALRIYDRTGETQKQAVVVQNIAWANYSLGRMSAALPLYDRALSQLRADEDPTLRAAILNNSALAMTFAGNHDAALARLGEALGIARTEGDRWWHVTILDNIGLVYDRLGEDELALDFYRQSLSLGDEQLSSRSRRNTLSKVAGILRNRQDYDAALLARKEALSLASGNTKALVSIQLATDYRVAGDLKAANQIVQSVLKDGKSLSEFARASALLERAEIERTQVLSSEAQRDYRESKRLFARLEVPERELAASLGLAHALSGKDAGSALDELQHTLRLAEDLRLQTANPELRATLLARSRPAFDLKIALLAREYDATSDAAAARRVAIAALQTAEQARARALADFRSLDLAASGMPEGLVREREQAYRELSTRRQRYDSLIESLQPDNPLVVAIRDDIAGLRRHINSIDASLARASVGATRGEAAPTDTLPTVSSQSAAIEYWLGDERAYAWVLTNEKISMVDLGSSTRINEVASAMRNALSQIGSGSTAKRLQPSVQLHDLVFLPLVADLAGRRRIAVVADGGLHYVPFAALRSPRGFLVESHDLTVVPSLWFAVDGRNSRAIRGVLIVSDPIYEATDPRLALMTRQGNAMNAVSDQREKTATVHTGLRRLPATAVEAAAVRELFDRREVTELTGVAATRDALLRRKLSGYRYIHIASHAIADPEIPLLSSLVLSTVDSQGNTISGRVLAADLMNVRLDAEVLVLSGCETAYGRRIEGEGLMGLQYTMIARGARNVVSSLWRVPDRSSADMMRAFYTDMVQREQPPGAALAEAMRSMLERGSDPGAWSAFTLAAAELPDGF